MRVNVNINGAKLETPKTKQSCIHMNASYYALMLAKIAKHSLHLTFMSFAPGPAIKAKTDINS